MSLHRYNAESSTRTKRKTVKTIKPRLILISLCTALLVAMALTAVKHVKLTKAQELLREAEARIEFDRSELAVLRTLNPYQIEYEQIITKAANSGDLFPGWITRVYQIPGNVEDIRSMMDMGAFVLDQTRFNLASHQSYGIEKPENALYQMSALFPSTKSGRHQIGIEFSLAKSAMADSERTTQKLSCFARIELNHKRVIDRKFKFLPHLEENKMLIGEVQLEKGIHPISATMYCDSRQKLASRDMNISVSFRAPGEQSLHSSRHAVYHVYKSGNKSELI